MVARPVRRSRSRSRAALDTLTSTPWRRAPWLLWRRPGVLVPTAGAAAVLAASLAAVPLFLSSAGTEAVALQADERCPRDTGATLRGPVTADDPFVPLAEDLGPSIQWGRFDTTLAGADPSSSTPAVVLFRGGAFDHLDAVEGTVGDTGTWVSDRGRELTGAGPDAGATIGGVTVPVDGIYRDLAAGTIEDPYWCAHRPDLLLEARGGDLVLPPPVVVVDEATWRDLVADASSTGAESAWEAPLRGEVTVTEARDLVDELACEGEQTEELTWCAGSGADADRTVESRFETSLPFVTERAGSIQSAVGGGVWPVAVLAAVAGAGLVAATALLWSDRRRREVALLGVRGVTPGAVAVKAVLELAGALVLGTAAGVGLAHGLVVAVGPSPTLEPGSIVRAWSVGVGALLLAGLVIAGVVALRARAGSGGRRPRWLRFVPWELALGAATLVSLRRLDAWGVPVSDGATVSRIDLVGLMFPVLFLTAMVAVAARLLVLALGPLRSLSRRWPNPLYLAVRRVDRHRSAVIGVVAASALATGVFGYAATIHRSLDATLAAKAAAYVGSDVVVRLPFDTELPGSLRERSTTVDLYAHAYLDLSRRVQVNVFAIDPATFAEHSSWDDSLSSASLEEIVDRLAAPSEGGRVPAVVVGLEAPTVADAAIEDALTTRFEIEQVADVQAFPGMRRGSPALFVAAPTLAELGVTTRVREERIQGDRRDILAALDDAGIPYEESATTENVVDAASFLTVSQTFGFMRSLAIASSLLVVGGVAVYLDARRRSRVLASAFVRRMGLTRRQHRRALLVEVLAGVGAGGWLGAVVALVAAGVAHERIDPLPVVPPDPVLRPAIALLVALGVGAVVVAVVAAAVAQRMTERDDPLEVLRAGT